MRDASRNRFLERPRCAFGEKPAPRGSEDATIGGLLIAAHGLRRTLFRSPLRDSACRQRWDLPPGNWSRITSSGSIAASGAMTPADIHQEGTSPSCLARNAGRTRLLVLQ